MSDNTATDRAVATAKHLENTEDPTDVDPLDSKLTVGLDGGVRDVTLVLTVGGPHVEVNVTNSTVTAVWGGDRHTTYFNNDGLADYWDRRIRDQYRAATA